MIIEIKSISGVLLWSGEAESLRAGVEAAVKSGADLGDADLRSADLRSANLGGADLGGANLRSANLRSANLGGADLRSADLGGANLRSANLVGADLRSADLGGANLGGADLGDANLGDADLGGVRDDLRTVLDAAPNEVAGLLTALRDGRVDGTQYQGECACLVGTIANLRHEPHDALKIDLRPDSSRPSEIWFLAIRKGDVPAASQVAAITAGWIEEWLTEHGQPIPLHVPLVWRGDVARLASELKAAGVDAGALSAAIEKVRS